MAFLCAGRTSLRAPLRLSLPTHVSASTLSRTLCSTAPRYDLLTGRGRTAGRAAGRGAQLKGFGGERVGSQAGSIKGLISSGMIRSVATDEKSQKSTVSTAFDLPHTTLPPVHSHHPHQPSTPVLHENIYTIPNLLTLSRILSCPPLGYFIITQNYELATGLLIYAGVTDWVDGWMARKWGMGTVLGSILDPAADKLLMGTLVGTLTVGGLLPCE